jgi:branched-chain amino acid transport system substrate-binding protein
MDRRQLLIGASALAFAPRVAFSQDVKPLKIGVMNDMSSVYADYQGVGSIVATKLAVEDNSSKLGVPVEIVSADHQNKPDVGSAIARRWIDAEGVEVIMDLPNSAVALAVLNVVTEKNKAAIGSGAGTSALTGPKCSKNFIHWTYDTYALGTGIGKALTEQGGRPGSSLRLTMPSARICATIAPQPSRRRAAKFSATCAIRSTPRISRRTFCRRRRRAPMSSASPMPAAI